MVLRALAADLLLDLGEGDDVHVEPPGPGGQLPGQLQHLVAGQLAGVGGRGEVDHLQLYAPLGDHVGGHRGIDAAGEQAHGAAAHADGQAAGGAHSGGVDVSRILPDLDMDGELRVVNVHRQVGKGVVKLAAHPLAQLDGAHGEALVGPLRLHLEGPGLRQRPAQIGAGVFQNGLRRLFTGHGPRDGDNAEDVGAGVVGAVHVAAVLHRLHIDGALAGVDLEAAEPAHAAADIVHEPLLEAVAVQALQDHLAQLAQDDLVHGALLISKYCCCGTG